MDEEKSLKVNQETMDVLVANVIPTTKYFEAQFNHLQYQINEVKDNQVKMQEDMDKRFEQVDKRFEQVDKRFEQVDKRFEQVDKRFEQVDKRFDAVNESIINLSFKIEKLTKSQETTIRDYIIERDRFYDKKFNNLRMFNIALVSLVGGIILKMAGVLQI